VSGGNLFQEKWFKYYNDNKIPHLKHRFIYIDTAQKIKDNNDYSVMQCWGLTYNNQVYLLDQFRKRMLSTELYSKTISFYEKHKNIRLFYDEWNEAREEYIKKEVPLGSLEGIKVEDKGVGTSLIDRLRKETQYKVYELDPGKRNKEERASDILMYFEQGNVYFPFQDVWVHDFISEVTSFPQATHDDQVDVMVYAITDMLYNKTKVVDYTNFGRNLNMRRLAYE
jgi:predicted phage terminase large subunit-like protein